MTDLEATVFKAWLHNDIAHWIEISEAGEAPHPATKHLPSYLGDLTLISAKELETAYYENEVAADLRFLKKRLLVHGKIGSINSGLRNKPYIHFSTGNRSEEHTSELQSLMRISYAVFCLKKKKTSQHNTPLSHAFHISNTTNNN